MLAASLYHAQSAVDSSLYYYRHRFWNHVPDPIIKAPECEDIDWTLEGSRQTNLQEQINCYRRLLKDIKEKKRS